MWFLRVNPTKAYSKRGWLWSIFRFPKKRNRGSELNKLTTMMDYDQSTLDTRGQDAAHSCRTFHLLLGSQSQFPTFGKRESGKNPKKTASSTMFPPRSRRFLKSVTVFIASYFDFSYGKTEIEVAIYIYFRRCYFPFSFSLLPSLAGIRYTEYHTYSIHAYVLISERD